MTPVMQTELAGGVRRALDVSERRVCSATGWNRTTIRTRRRRRPDSYYAAELRKLAAKYPRFGYRRMHAMLRRQGDNISRGRVLSIMGAEGLLVRRLRKRRPQRAVVRRPMRLATARDMGWALDFISEQLVTGERIRALTIIDEHTREIVGGRAAASFKAADVVNLLDTLAQQRRTLPIWLHSDNGSEFVPHLAQRFLQANDVLHIRNRPGTPTDNAQIESFQGRMRDELFDRELFNSVAHAQMLLYKHIVFHNTIRPHSSLNYLTPAEFAAITSRHCTELA